METLYISSCAYYLYFRRSCFSFACNSYVWYSLVFRDYYSSYWRCTEATVSTRTDKKLLYSVLAFNCWSAFIIAGVTSTIDNVQDIREGSIQGVVRAGNLKKPTSRYGRAYVITYRGHYWKEISSNRTVALDNTREVEVWYRPSFLIQTRITLLIHELYTSLLCILIQVNSSA